MREIDECDMELRCCSHRSISEIKESVVTQVLGP